MTSLVRIVSVADSICKDVNLSCRQDVERYCLGGDCPVASLESLAGQLQVLGVEDLSDFGSVVEGIVEQAREAVKAIYS